MLDDDDDDDNDNLLLCCEQNTCSDSSDPFNRFNFHSFEIHTL